MRRTLEVLNDLEKQGVFSRYAIGGAMAATFYTEPVLTFDLDVFVVLLPETGQLMSLAPVYEALRARGYGEEKEAVMIEGRTRLFSTPRKSNCLMTAHTARSKISHYTLVGANYVRDFPLLLKCSSEEAQIVSARRRCNGREATARLSNQHASRVRYPTALVAARVLRLHRVSAVRRLRLLDRREDLRQGLRGYRARRMTRDDWPVLCVTRRFVRLSRDWRCSPTRFARMS
jgi:hypothetical protein